MRTGQIFLSAIHLVISVCLVAAGVILYHTFNDTALMIQAVSFLQKRPDILKLVGLSLTGFGAFLILVFSWIHRHKYYEVSLAESSKFVIDPRVLAMYTKHFWKEEIKEALPHDIYLDVKGNLCIIASLKDDKSEIKILEKIENELSHLLFQNTGFNKSILLTSLKN